VLAIVGPSGAGKSTLINLLSGTIKPRAGSILLDGRSIGDIPHRELARNISVVPQMATTPFGLSTLEIVLMGRTPYISPFGFESKDDIDIALDAMRQTDCYEFRSRGMHELSGGERQRVLVARAIAQKPKILMLDEPTTFLDIRHVSELVGMLRRLHADNGITIVCALHDLNIATSICNRIVLMKNGAMEANGAPAEIIDSATIRRVFDTDVHIAKDPGSGRPYFLP